MFETVEDLVKALVDLGGLHPRTSWDSDCDIGFIIDEEIETGGAQGGNCWDGDARSYSTDESFGQRSILDEFLETHYPDISYLRYRKLRLAVISISIRTQTEYYGNYTDYDSRLINIQELFSTLLGIE